MVDMLTKKTIVSEKYEKMIKDADRYMRMALNLARRGIGSVEPNPIVGAVITKANQIIGRGWHRIFGGPHAEINALEDCKTLGVNPRGAAMYVTLEPCCHKGKTGPCTQAIIDAGLAKVYIATKDPSEHTNGKSVELLKKAGIEVHLGACEKEAKLLNAPFMKFVSTGKCWVVLKWAQTIDGKVASADISGKHKWVSNEISRRDVHKLRRRSQAILVGINTVLADNPLLTARPGTGKKATRIVLDSFLRISLECKLLMTAKDGPVLIVASQSAAASNPWVAQQVVSMGAELLTYPDTLGKSNLFFLLEKLSKRGIAQLLVEGGPTVLTSFIRENLADEIHVYITPKIFGRHGSVSIAEPMAALANVVGLHNVSIKSFGGDVRLTGMTEKALKELSIPV